ncbi:LysR family transcriptional regulator [Roseixanthobacter pseudopolyaromaticivorans]|uniref:LysR family transcriptional regulator n=1 Tax=Xanthobacteraceae TaxID=335928 RepID=UPI003727D692
MVRTSSDMEVFVAVVDGGSLSAGAGALEMTRSGVCRRLEQLERRLGVRLLNRTTRQLNLTEPGQAYLTHSRQALKEIEKAEQAAMTFQRDPRGILKVVSPVMIGLHVILPLTREFLATYSELTLNLVVSDEPSHSMQDFDVIIAFGSQPDSSLISHKVAESRRLICAAPSYLAAHGTPLCPEDLGAHNCLLLSGLGSSSNEWAFRGEQGVQNVRVKGNFVVNNGDAHYAALLAGVGIGRATDLRVRDDVAAGRLVVLLDTYAPDKPTPIYALHHSREQVPPKVRSFIDFYKQRLSAKSTGKAAAAS